MSSLNGTDSLDLQEAKMIILNKMETWAATRQQMSNFIDSGSNLRTWRCFIGAICILISYVNTYLLKSLYTINTM